MSEYTTTPGITDADLVTAYLTGDRGAFAAIYDRYGDALYDVAAAMLRNRHDAADVTQDTFVVAAERMGQLRQPDRLKPWLMAILRNEVYRRSGRRARQVPTDFSQVAAEMALPPVAADESSGAEFEELATLVREAAAGLDARDQLVLELTVRQGLEGDDLAAALGVSAQQSYSLVHRMRQRTERSLGAFCVARRGRRDCPGLDAILAGWDGQFSVLIRKRVARHIDDCTTCTRNRKKFVPLMLFGSAPAFAAPADLRDRVLGAVDAGAYGLSATALAPRPYAFTAPGGFPTAPRYSRRVLLWWLMTAAAVVLLLGAGAYTVAGDDGNSPQLAIDVPTTTITTTTTTTTSTTVPTTTSAAPIVAPPTPTSAPTTAATTTAAPTTAEATTTTDHPDKTTTTTSSTLPFTTTSLAVAPPGPTTTTTDPPATTASPATTTTEPAATTTQPTTTTQPPPPPGALFLSSGTLDFGTVDTTRTVQLVNEGGGPAEWSAGLASGGFAGGTPFDVSPTAGSLGPGGQVTITVTMDRSGLAAGDYAATISFIATGTSAQLTAHGTVPEPEPTDSTPPSVRISRFDHFSCNGYVEVTVIADDPESGIASYAGTVTWGSSSATLVFNGNVGTASINPPPPGATSPPLQASVTVRNGAGLSASTTASRAPEPCIT
jgi:RNA polymerase sigma factor (sigma-70 family)